MANTTRTYTSDGIQTIYPVDFTLGFIHRDYVYIHLESDVHTTQLSYSWIDDSQIQLDTPVASTVNLVVSRVIPRDILVNDYEDGAILRGKHLDESNLQHLMLEEEGQDASTVSDATLTTLDSKIDAEVVTLNTRIDTEVTTLNGRIDTEVATLVAVDEALDVRVVTLETSTSGDTRYIHYIYNDGEAIGGETTIAIPYTFTNIVTLHVNGVSMTQSLAFSADSVASSVTFAEPLEEGDEVVVSIGTEPLVTPDVSLRREFVHSEPTLNAAIVSDKLMAGDAINLAERTTGNGGGAMWDVVLSSSVTENTFNIVQCTGVPTLSLVMRNNYDSITLRVPSQYPDMQTAIDTYRKTGASGGYTKVIVYIETGHALTNGLVCEKGDFSFIEITSQDATVLLDVVFTPAVTPNDIPTSNSNPVMFADSCIAPLWSILVDAELKDIAGITYRASSGKISSGSGVNNANRMGLIVTQASVVAAHECSFVNSGDGNRTSTGSTLTAFAANFSNARALTETQAAGMDVSRGSTFNCASNTSQARTNLTGCAKFALNCRRSRISASRADCTGAGENAIRNGYGGFIECDSALLDSSTSHAINSSTGSVMARGASINLCGARGVLVDQGGVVNVSGATITNCTGEALYAFDGGEITANSANVTGFLSTNAVSAFDSSKITANGLVGSPVFAVTPNIITDNGVIMTEAVVSNFGKAIVLNTTSSIDVTHGLDFEPNDRTINIMPINALSAQANYYISTVGATTFRINVVGGASGDTQFAWDATSAP
jgi:hypothetical protein